MDGLPANLLPKVTDKLQGLREAYSTALGGYCEWNNSVDLGPPKSRLGEIVIPEEDKWVLDYYNSLQYTFYETGYPETIDRSATPRTDFTKNDITVTILASPVECMAILNEGGRQYPGSFCLVLSTTWISKVPSMSHPNLYSLYVHKAISFDRGGYTYIEEYDPPRKTTYLMNYFTGPITSGQRTDGEAVEENLDCPMSSSLKLATITDDKVFTRCIMADIGMAFPETLAFMYKCDRQFKSSTDKIKIIRLDKNVGVENLVTEEVKGFTEKLAKDGVAKVVVKPSGAAFHGSVGVSFHAVNDIASITAAVTLLLKELVPTDSAMVETFIDTLAIEGSDKTKPWGASNDFAARVRCTVCRGPDDRVVATQIICGISSKSKPVNGDNTVCQSLNSTLLAYGVESKEERTLVVEDINRKSEALLRTLIAFEETLSVEEKGALYGQTDLIGVDLIIARKNGKIIPVGIEVNSHDCTINCQIFEFLNAYLGSDQGESVRPFVQTMIKRSNIYTMMGKTILVIGGGAYSKSDIWMDAEKYGIKIVLVDADKSQSAKDKVYKYIYYNYNDDHVRDHSHAINIVHLLSNLRLDVEGCLTFRKDCGPLAAKVCEILQLTGNDYNAAFIAKTKSLTQGALRGKADDIPHWPRTYLYTSAIQPVHSEQDLLTFVENNSFPVVLKLEYSHGAGAVFFIQNTSELQNKFMEVKNTLQSEEDFGKIGLGFGNNMVIMEFLDGSEHNVDIVLYKRKMLGAFLSDNGPTRMPYFTETVSTMPTILPADKASQLVAAAYQCCTEIGLANGVFSVELKLTTTGPKLLGINARMGGFYIRDWIQRIYGVDLMMCAMMISCGVKPYIPKLPPKCHLMGVMLVPSMHKKFLEDGSEESNVIKGKAMNGEIIWNQFDSSIAQQGHQQNEQPMANIAVIGSDVKSAKQKLLSICGSLKITTENYSVEKFADHF